MNRFKYSIVVALMGGVLLSGCSDFLEPKSKSEFVPKDATSLNEMLLGEAYPRRNVERLNLFMNLLDDDITAAPFQEPQEGFDVNLYFAPYTWQPEMCKMMYEAGYAHPNIYYPYYELILGCNAVLDYIDDVTDSEENINKVKAQAYALRGFYYLNLVNIFGVPYNSNPEALGVPLKITSKIEDAKLTRNSVKEVYVQIEKDLLEAERLYKTFSTEAKPYWEPDTRTSLPMVQLLLSRMYLYMENWAEASKYANYVMQNKSFRLLDLATVAAKATSYPYLPVYQDYHSYSISKEVIWVYGSLSDMVKWVSDNGTSSDGRVIHPYFRASDELLNCFDETEGDLRKDRYVTRSNFQMELNGEMVRMPQAFGKVAMQTSSNYYKPYYSSSTFGRSLRLSEAYMNYIEAEAMRYKAGEAASGTNALDALNKFRQYRIDEESYQALSITDPDELLAFVQNERRRELCYEGLRWFDLRRWGMKEIKHIWYDGANSAQVYTLSTNDPGFVVPIPDESLDKNSSLEQNPLAESPRVGVIVE